MLTAASALLASIALASCGSAAGDQNRQTYAEVLNGLDRAARSAERYGAVQRAEHLEPGDEHVLESFCSFARDVVQNQEAFKLARPVYVVSRIRTNAYALGNADAGAIFRAMGRLDAAVDISSVDAAALERYAKACYR